MEDLNQRPKERSTFVGGRRPDRMRTAVLLLSCVDRPGIVAAVSEFLYSHGGNILTVDQYSEASDGQFFQRVEFELEQFTLSAEGILPAFQPIADKFAMHCELRLTDQVARIALLASKQDHCLLDLLARYRTGELEAEIAFVASNHPDHQATCDFFGVPFHHVPIVDGDKDAQQKELVSLIEGARADLVVLARYMQILSDWFIELMPNKIINIHHSLLPAFVGAKPYQQAYGRGVKIVGATAHYATSELDEGPIITQDIARISHRDTAEDLVRRGKDVEALALARAVRLHLAAKVIVHGNRTVVFD